MKLEELTQKLQTMNQSIKRLLREVDYQYEEYLESVQIDESNPDEVQLMTEYMSVLKRLESITWDLDYFKQPIAHEGTLHMNRNGRYEVDGVELTCGSPLEVLVQDSEDDSPEWVASRIEADHGYYFVARRNLPLEGKRARIRERKW